MKATTINRLGDVMVLIGTTILYLYYGTCLSIGTLWYLISYSPPSIIHYTTYVYMSCLGCINTTWYLSTAIGIQTIGVYL